MTCGLRDAVIILVVVVMWCVFIYVPQKMYSSSYKREQLKPVFDEYVIKHNKSYRSNSEEYDKRFEHFMQSVDEIDLLNAESIGPENCKARYGLTSLSDMSKDEFRNIHLSDENIVKVPLSYQKKTNNNIFGYLFDSFSDNDKTDDDKVYERRKRASGLPLEVDWRKKGVIGSVKNQGVCGACWAFSTVGTIEAMAAIATNKLEELSVQEMIDCSRPFNDGCSGGDICLLLDWLVSAGAAIERESAYPLRLTDGACRRHSNTTGVKVKTFTCHSMVNDEDKILQTLATHGPVTVAVNAITWQHYLDGVIQYHCSGAIADLNHAIQLVGYNMSAQVPYYIGKNSWGKEFGDDGYLKLAVGTNICGLANEVATIDVMP